MNNLGRYLKLLLPAILTLLISGLGQAAWGVTPQVGTGIGHTVTLRSDGTIWTAGANTSGQLGDGTNLSRTAPVQVGLLGNATGWVAVAAGGDHTLALKADGSLWAWGANDSGQLGDGSTAGRSVPVRIGGAGDYWTAIAAGESSSFAIRGDGTLWAWGDNGKGQLGDGTTANRTSPVRVGNAANWVAVAAGDLHTLALKSDGSLWAWGANQSGQIAQDPADTAPHSAPAQIIVPTAFSDNDWSAVAAGGSSSFALKADGTLWAWGLNDFGQLGIGVTDATPHAAPVQVTADRDWKALSAGKLHALAVKRNGSLWAWGDNTSGQLGDGTQAERNTPTRITFPADITDIVAVAAGAFHSLAAKAGGEIYAWGDNGAGQLGSGTNVGSSSPLPAGEDEIGWVGVEPGGEFTVARRSNGTLWTWGNNTSGQLGDGTLTPRSTPSMVGAAANWVAQAAGWSHTAALRADGTLWTWGDNANGQLGDGTTANRQAPTLIAAAKDWSAVAAGDFHTLALQADGTLWAWGDNANGQLGDGTILNRTSPVQIVTGNPGDFDRHWVAIAAGGAHSLALQADGTLYAWGDNGTGQLGNPDFLAGINSPRQIFNLTPPTAGWNSNWVAIAAGLGHSLALQADGTLWAWGSNFSGRLGNGNTTNQPAPVQVLNPGSAPYVAVAAGDAFSVARQADGSLWSWGNNTKGQLGNGTTDPDPLNPVPHPTPARENGNASDWVAAGSGGSHAVALKASGILWEWGNNAKGQLGDATTIARNVPAPLVEMRIDAAPAAISFGPSAIGASSARTITISNSGTAPLKINGLSLGGANSTLFSVTAGTCGATPFTVAASRNCTVSVAFGPALPAGAKSAALTIASNDPITPEAKVSLSGSAVAPFVITASVAAGNGTISPSGPVPVLPGSSQAFAITPGTGYRVADVLVDGVSKGAVGSLILPPVTADGTVTAAFAVSNYTVTLNAGAGGAIAGPPTANHGDAPAYAIMPNLGYHIVDVQVDGVSKGVVTAVTLPPLIGNAEITAAFAPNTYAVSRNAGPGGTINGPATANHGDTPAYAITPNAGYHVADVKVDGVSRGAVTAVTLLPVTADATITAAFVKNYTVDVQSGARGSVSPAGIVSVTSAGTTFTFTPLAGYDVVNVVVDGVPKGSLPSYTFTNVVGDTHTLRVVFIPDGDVNNDGTVDIADALTALRITVGLVTPSATNILHGDAAPLDAGGVPVPNKEITVSDALMILKKVVGLTSGW